MRIAVALHRDHAVGAPLLLPRHGDDVPHGDRYRLALQGQIDPWVLPAILVCENNHCKELLFVLARDGVEFEVNKILGEVILTLGSSRTVLEFLCPAKEKKRSFRVFVAEGAPRYQGHLLANDLVTRGLQTTLITDSAVFAMISRVNMVIVGAHAVMANGGVTTPVGMFLWLNILQLCQNLAAIEKKKPEDIGATSKTMVCDKDISKEGKQEKLSVLETIASMDQKPNKPKKGSSSSSLASSRKSKTKVAPKVSSYTYDIDLPPSDDDDDDNYASEEELPDVQKQSNRQRRSEFKPLEMSVSDKQLKKREKKDTLAAYAVEQAKQEALKYDHDAFIVVNNRRSSVLDGDDEANANVKDVIIDDLSVSVRRKELLKNTSVKISHGKRYGFVGTNGMGKSTLLKLLAWRKIPVPKNIDLLLVEQEVVGDDRTALEAVVSANEELARLRKEVEFLQNSFSSAEGEDEIDDCNGDDVGEKLAELYEKLRILGSDAAEAQASKILAGMGFTKEMQGRPTRSFSGGWRMRISLAMALFVQPTLLLLDEPTNHLDLRAVLWLEEYLCRWKKTLVVVSHDRDFLNTVCNEIIHLHDLKLHFYRGNFDDFETGYEQRRKEMSKKYEDYVRKDKAAKRSGNQDQQQKVKEQAKHNAAKEEEQEKGQG
ncbi:hypothetical protein CMV_001619 [Castanea mollissima]|uniref:ABC transporter domain-containing protein n=1 Tax=Castanea mollissima TaxID=60419 RepID=A0A8J4W6B1_9ROSI|nr:hypothetical protein CMV_001619 [Castanea mollissima]